MDQANSELRLNQIKTIWPLVVRANGSPGEKARAARHGLLRRYQRAVREYLLGALEKALGAPKGREVAEELAQDFALRLLEGRLTGANARCGRFREFVKGVLRHMIADYFRGLRGQPQPLPPSALDGMVATGKQEEVTDSWAGLREELLARTWRALERFQHQTGRPYYSVLQLRLDHPHLRSTDSAEKISAQLGKRVSAAGFRQTLHRARAMFGEVLLLQVAARLRNPTIDALEERLADLDFLVFCRPALVKLRPNVCRVEGISSTS
jgi:hypothetical protein